MRRNIFLLAILLVVAAGIAVTITRRGPVAAVALVDRFNTLLPGTALPTGAECAKRVRRSAWEPRPENAAPNGYIALAGTDYNIENKWGGDEAANARLIARIDGAFTGTTDEIIQWGACKWGFDEDGVRAVAVQESDWRMSAVGDQGQSFGLLQIKRTALPGSYPASARSTAFNVDFALAVRRACYEGNLTWLVPHSTPYAAGDEWGCIGAYFSGKWYDEGAQGYIAKVKAFYDQRIWQQPDF